MSDEIKNEEQKETKCFCQSKGFRNFLTIALGTFVGMYCALSLFAALHRPPMMPPMAGPGMRGCPCKMIHNHHHFNRIPDGRFDRPDSVQTRPAPFETPRQK